MSNSARLVFVAAGEEPFRSEESELDSKLSDYYDRFIAVPPVDEHFDLISDSTELDRWYDAVEQGLLTKGQWLLFIISGFSSLLETSIGRLRTAVLLNS